jgi:hypothetical protein
VSKRKLVRCKNPGLTVRREALEDDKGANMVEPNRADMERAKIVLDDALPYELDMLDAAVRYMQMDESRN